MLKITNTNEAPQAIGPYSQAVTVGNFVFTSGQIPLDPATGKIVGETIEEQTHRVCRNLKAVLEASSTDMKNVIKTVCFLSDMENFARFNAVYEEYFVSKPARSCVEVARLPKDALLEIEVVAERVL